MILNNILNNMEWNKYDWTYCPQDASGCTKLIKHNFPNITFYGQLDKDGIPNGLGALSCEGTTIKCGQWYNGELIEVYDREEYDKEMDWIQSRK